MGRQIIIILDKDRKLAQVLLQLHSNFISYDRKREISESLSTARKQQPTTLELLVHKISVIWLVQLQITLKLACLTISLNQIILNHMDMSVFRLLNFRQFFFQMSCSNQH